MEILNLRRNLSLWRGKVPRLHIHTGERQITIPVFFSLTLRAFPKTLILSVWDSAAPLSLQLCLLTESLASSHLLDRDSHSSPAGFLNKESLSPWSFIEMSRQFWPVCGCPHCILTLACLSHSGKSVRKPYPAHPSSLLNNCCSQLQASFPSPSLFTLVWTTISFPSNIWTPRVLTALA